MDGIIMKARILFFPVIIFCMCLMLCLACTQDKSAWQGTIEEVDGVTLVKNPKQPLFGEEVFAMEEELTIGEAAGRKEYMFAEIRSIAVDEEERVYVLDGKESHIKVFSRDGEYIRTIGKKGQGPGEIGLPRSVLITTQNELVVPDISNRRLAFFSLEGEFKKNVSSAKMRLMSTRIDSLGNIIGIDAIREEENPRYELKKFDLDMNYLFSYGSSPLPGVSSFNPFMAVLRWDLDKDDRIFCGYPETYEINVFDRDGNVIRKIERDYEPQGISEEELEELEEIPASIKLSIPKYHAAYNRIQVDDKNRIFVLTWERIEDGEGYYYDVFDPEGKYIARIPLEVMPRVWKKGKLYTVEEDEDGYQYVKRYNITWRY